MKKIIITTSILALTSLSYAGDFKSAKYNWNGSTSIAAKVTKSSVTNNTLIAHQYNRNNSVSTADIQKVGKSKLGYSSVLATAKAEQEKAKKVGFEWNTIRKLMKAAKKDHKGGNDDAAIKKLNKAITHAKLGQKQAVDQANAGPRF